MFEEDSAVGQNQSTPVKTHHPPQVFKIDSLRLKSFKSTTQLGNLIKYQSVLNPLRHSKSQGLLSKQLVLWTEMVKDTSLTYNRAAGIEGLELAMPRSS